MSETVKINLTKMGAALGIILILASVVGAAYIGYDNAKTAKVDAKEALELSQRVELRQVSFEGKIDERTRNHSEDMKELKSDVKLLLNKLELSDG